MSHIHLLVFSSFLLPVLLSCAGPSAGAKGVSGATGTIEFKPTDHIEGATTWWVDSDGVALG